MVWDDVSTLWEDSNDKYKLSLTSKESAGCMGNNVDVNDEHTDGYEGNVYHGYTDTHTDTGTWSEVVSRGTI